MGNVYVLREGQENRFTVGAAKDFVSRRRSTYSRHNPGLSLYRLLNAADHFALERFLHEQLEQWRIQRIRSRSWYEVTSEEIDRAIERADKMGRAHIARRKEVAELKRRRSTGKWLPPTEHLEQICARLAIVTREKKKFANEEERLKFEAMVYVGDAEGVEGLFRWTSESQNRFQSAAFRKSYPELYESFRAEEIRRKFYLWNGDQSDEECN